MASDGQEEPPAARMILGADHLSLSTSQTLGGQTGLLLTQRQVMGHPLECAIQ